MLKKVVLSGYPVKVQKKKAVVRWMFHSPEDIRWFRPVDLWTKHGRRGQITVRTQPRRRPERSCIAVALTDHARSLGRLQEAHFATQIWRSLSRSVAGGIWAPA